MSTPPGRPGARAPCSRAKARISSRNFSYSGPYERSKSVHLFSWSPRVRSRRQEATGRNCAQFSPRPQRKPRRSLRCLRKAFDNRDVRLAAALTHRLQTPGLVLVLECMKECGHQLGAGRAKRVAERDRAAVHIDLCRISMDIVEPRDGYGGECLVDFVDIDVANLLPAFLEGTLRCRQRRFEHDNRVATDDSHVMDARERLHAKRFQSLLIAEKHARGAIADLA